MSRRVSVFLMAFAVFSWWIWPTFLANIWKDSRSWDHGATGFFLVHLVLVIVSFVLGTVIGSIGLRGWLGQRRIRRSAVPGPDAEREPAAR